MDSGSAGSPFFEGDWDYFMNEPKPKSLRSSNDEEEEEEREDAEEDDGGGGDDDCFFVIVVDPNWLW